MLDIDKPGMRDIQVIADHLEGTVFLENDISGLVEGINNFSDLTVDENKYLSELIESCTNCGVWVVSHLLYEGGICEDCEFEIEEEYTY